MKVCVLQPDYSTTSVDYKNYDPPRILSSLLPGATVDNVFLNKLTTYRQLKELKSKGYDVFVNLCEGYLEWEVPSIDVIHSLDLLNLPYTGPSASLYDPPKELMKYVAYTEGVSTPLYALLKKGDNVEEACKHLSFPLFVKPAKAGDSLGVDEKSRVSNFDELKQKVEQIAGEYDELLVEEYIDGREFTVLIAANASNEKEYTVFKPIEFIFPVGNKFKTYALKTSELHPEANIPCNDAEIETKLRNAAQRIFRSFGGVGYARMDFRVNDKKEVYFLEINFTCSVFYTDGYEGSADYILKHDGIGQAGFLQHIIAEGIARHQRKQKKYNIKGNAIAGFGIYANREIKAKELIFKGEEMAQRIATRRHVEETWSREEKEIFRHYAYPLSKEVFLLWDENPAEWAPQNHSCDPNTAYDGLNVVSIRDIKKGEELTLDYTSFLDEHMEAFDCRCGSPKCKGIVAGIPKNSVTKREEEARHLNKV
ncbi:MAG: SET domain-containing protein-lysine N-methyltransferase [Sphingobacteriales bacterium]|nr:SET domain-containing protein-lysine N-methyltransferase [Sphingobacteriales bacterium]MBI3720331.1 SET domain-containing protein-lysine N-methyltransferase [Sphingobacteriales bacterium]